MPASKNQSKPRADCLTVLCPITQSAIPTRIATDVRALAKAWHTKIKVSCPHCQEVHQYRVCDAFVETAISNARLRGDLPAQEMLNSPLVSRNGRTGAPTFRLG